MNDYISRQAAIDAILAIKDYGNSDRANALGLAECAVTTLPSVQPERKRGKGRWNVYYHGEENGKSIFTYSCNQCGYGAPYNFIGGVCEQKKWNFCPNCGADMRG